MQVIFLVVLVVAISWKAGKLLETAKIWAAARPTIRES
jgi:hypothetical protein